MFKRSSDQFWSSKNQSGYEPLNLENGSKAHSMIFDSTSAKQIFTQKFESPSFQIEHKINWKVDASSRVIQSKIHSKSKCSPPNNFGSFHSNLDKKLLKWNLPKLLNFLING